MCIYICTYIHMYMYVCMYARAVSRTGFVDGLDSLPIIVYILG